MKTKELNKIAKKLQELDYRELCDGGLKNINGGFAKIDMYDFDDDIIYVENTMGDSMWWRFGLLSFGKCKDK